ncbi:MAG: polyisoprenoid-binding protein [Planctomycetota bacterium]|nr:MAG: polyisoprenoid-binding protein [Planctomycetota bacterium]
MNWLIDDVHTHIGFSVKHMMVSTVRGQFKTYRGTVNLDPSDFERSTFEGEVDVGSIDTGVAQRDDHLRTSDFFDAEEFPTLTFRNTKVTKTGENTFDVMGDLTIRGVTKPVTLHMTFLGKARDPWGNERVGFEGELKINRKDYGLMWNAALETGGFLVGDEVKINLQIQAVAK